jgi:hypothetical protein
MNKLPFENTKKTIISTEEAKKILGVNYQDFDEKIILALIKELEYLSEIALGFP